MRINFYTGLFLFCMPFLLIQCATRQDVQTLDFRTRNLDNKLVELDEALTKLENRSDLAKKQTVDIVQKQQAGIGETVERLQSDILQSIGEMDEMSHTIDLFRSENDEFHDQTESQLAEALEKINELAEQLEKVATDLNEIKIARAREAEERARIAALEAERAKKRRQQQSVIKVIRPRKVKTAKKDVQQKSNEPGMASYKKAYGLYKKKKYEESFHAFSKYIDSYPQGSMVPNARFWLADSLYGQKEYELAILEYQKVIDSYPQHEKAAAALLKEGLAFERLKDNTTAVIVYEKLLAEYPSSKQVEAAQKRLKKIR